MVVMLPAKALHDAFGLNAMVATSFQAAGGAGQKGIDELTGQVAQLGEDVDQLINDGRSATCAGGFVDAGLARAAGHLEARGHHLVSGRRRSCSALSRQHDDHRGAVRVGVDALARVVEVVQVDLGDDERGRRGPSARRWSPRRRRPPAANFSIPGLRE